jgi:hypothetical protein
MRTGMEHAGPPLFPQLQPGIVRPGNPHRKAAAFAERGVKLDPTNQRVRMIMAFILLFKNELSAGLAEVDRALQLNPNSLISS